MTNKQTLSQDQIEELLTNGKITLTNVVDAVINLNGIIGVGLITLGDDLNQYVRSHKGGRYDNRR